MSCKYIIVVGGVYSGTGKGIAASSIGLLLKMRGVNVQYIKCDPYLNVNAGTMNPRQHGEVYLCDDGSETDLDLGHVERLIGITVSSNNIFTSGSLYKKILVDEENGKYLGETVQVVPHVTKAIQDRLQEVGAGHDILLTEIGGTIGDFESGPFFEAISELKHKNPQDVLIIMVAPIIWNDTVKEFKTKPLQNAVRSLRHDGLIPEMILCRCDRSVPDAILDKVSRLTGVSREAVFEAPDAKSIYQVPIEFYDRHVDDIVADRFQLPRKGVKIHKYRDLVEKYNNGENLQTINIGIVSKYDNCDEAYLSLKEALMHASVKHNVKHEIRWINAETLEEAQDMRSVWRYFESLQGVIVPGGFDTRGVEGKIKAVQYCREKKIPFLGICLGLQCSVIEFCRNVLDLKYATSREFNHSKSDEIDYVIDVIEGQSVKLNKSGTMRLGSYDCNLRKDSISRNAYGRKTIQERHRHHYEVNDKYTLDMENKGFIVTGRNPDSNLVEVMELSKELHPYFVGTQAHPEFKSKLSDPAPLFSEFVKISLEELNKNNE